MFAALWIGAVILVSNFGYGWYTDTISVQTQYRAFTSEEIVADVGLHIGLRGINITLKGNTITIPIINNCYHGLVKQVQHSILMVIWLMKLLTTMNSFIGRIPGLKVALVLADLLVVSIKNSEQHNIVACPIPYYG